MKNEVFADTIGQSHAIQLLSQSIASGINGGEMFSPLVVAEAGGGKTHLMQRKIQALKEAGLKTLFFSSPEEFRERSSNYDSFVELITGSDPFAIAIDELHMIHHRKTVQLDKIWAFLMKALDRTNEGRMIRFDAETSTTFSRKRGCFILGTNFPEKLDSSGAFQSRCDIIKLDPYSVDELVQILQVMLQKEGFQAANENTLKQIARCGRGTARPMASLISQLKMGRSASGETRKTINREDVFEALKLSKMFPRGLRNNEIKLLKLCNMPLRDNVILATLPDMEKDTLSKSKGFLIGQGFATPLPSGLQTSILGKTYLEQSRKEGFVI